MEGQNDPTRTKALCYQAIERDPLNADATERLERLLQHQGLYDELAQFLDGHIRRLEAQRADPTYIGTLSYRLADVWNKQFGESEHALQWYRRAYTLDPQCVAALYEARLLYAAGGDHQSAIELLEMEANVEPDAERRVSLLSELARSKARDLGDVNGAIMALRGALALLPGDVQVMHELATYLVERAGSSDEATAAIDLKRAAELFYRIAQGVSEEECLEYLEAALRYAPYHESAIDMLEDTAERLGRADLLPAAWVGFVAHAPAGPAVDERRLKLARAYADANQIDDAIFCIEEVAERGDQRAIALIDELNERAGRPPRELAPSLPVKAKAERARGGDDEDPDFAAALMREDGDEGSEDQPPTVRPPKKRLIDSDPPPARAAAPQRVQASEPPPPAVAPSRIAQLKTQLTQLARAGRDADAETVCHEILGLDPSDADAFTFLEGFYRKKRRHEQLRDLLLSTTRVPGLSVEARKLRLREVAGISETKLRDADGAIGAWRNLLAIDPADVEAAKTLKRLLEKAKQWDELVQVLEREALLTSDTEAKADLISQIALLHRDKRKDLPEALEAYRQLYTLHPNDKSARDALCEIALALESYEDAVPLLRERAEEMDKERDKLALMRQLISVLDDKLADAERAYEACERMLELAPKDKELLDRMERIDERGEHHERLLSVLERRLELVPRAERAALYTRMASVADRALNDLDRAASLLQQALEIAPGTSEIIESLIDLFDRAERFDELVKLLSTQAAAMADPVGAADLWRRIARLQAQELKDTGAAATTWKRVLDQSEDEEALRFLHGHAVQQQDHAQVATYLRRLAYLVPERDEKLELLFERAQLLQTKLNDPAEAINALRQILDDVDAEHDASLELLLETAEQTGDKRALADGLRRRLALQHAPEERIATAQRLADLCENEIKDNEGAVQALQAWTESDAGDPVPFRRLRALLTAADRFQELLHVLDALAGLEGEEPARNEATIAAARLAFDHFGDADGAWDRLLPLFEDNVEDAERELHELARKAGREELLASLYVGHAQDATEEGEQARNWAEAARIYEEYLNQPKQALEAALRMLACDLNNRDYLTHVDRLASSAGAWPRLTQVYDRLLKQTEAADAKVALLVRHAKLLDEGARDPSEALDRVMRACSLDPTDEELLKRAEDLGLRAKRSEELLMVYDRRKAKAETPREKIDFILRAARLSDDALQDRERAVAYLRQALALTEHAPDAADVIWQTAVAFDAARPELGADDARRAVIRAHRDIAEKAPRELGSALILRAAQLLRTEMKDVAGTFDALRHGAGLFPTSPDVLEALWDVAHETKRLDALDAHLSRLIDDALDSKTAVALLRQRGRLLEGPLARHADAAEVYGKLLQLDPSNEEAPGKLRACLMRAGRFQDLLLVIDKQAQRTASAHDRLELLKETARVWEDHLKNRWEALDAWRKVLASVPDDEDGLAAITRLSGDTAAPKIDVAKLLSDEPDDEATGAGEVAPARAHVIPDRRSTRPPPRASEPPPALKTETSAPDDESAVVPTPATLPTTPSDMFAVRGEVTVVDEAAPTHSEAASAEVEDTKAARSATTLLGVPAISPAEAARTLPTRDDEDDETYDDVSDDEVSGGGLDDLAALDAALATTKDDRDFLDEDEVTPAPVRASAPAKPTGSLPPAPGRARSVPPPPPPRSSRPASLPPPPGRSASTPPRVGSLPPPPPPRGSAAPSSAPPPLPPRRR